MSLLLFMQIVTACCLLRGIVLTLTSFTDAARPKSRPRAMRGAIYIAIGLVLWLIVRGAQ